MPKISSQNLPCITAAVGDQPGEHAESRAGLQREAPAVTARQHAERQRAEPHAEHHAGDRQRRQTFSGASIAPTMLAVETMTVLLPPASACATASTMALRRASASSIGGMFDGLGQRRHDSKFPERTRSSGGSGKPPLPRMQVRFDRCGQSARRRMANAAIRASSSDLAPIWPSEERNSST